MSVIDFLTTRRSVSAAFMAEPGPSGSETEAIISAGIRVPDHGKLAPWRFILFEGEERAKAGELLLELRRRRGNALTAEAETAERERFTRAPLVIGVVSRAAEHPKIPVWEQQLSAGAVCMNIMNGAHALGYAAQWLTDWPIYDVEACAALGLAEHEKLAGFIHIGTPQIVPQERPRPEPAELMTRWTSRRSPPISHG